MADPVGDQDLVAYASRQSTPVLLRARVRARLDFPEATHRPVVEILNRVLAGRGVHLDLVDHTQQQ